MKLIMIRHGKTKGNVEGRYVGCTDEDILKSERSRLQKKKLPQIDILYVSPMKRCVETAKILYPGKAPLFVPDFRECDFGAFEYQNYKELNGNKDYQKFIDTMGMSGFPGGETRVQFQKRCCMAFEKILMGLKEKEKIAMVVHGGTIMAILDAFSDPHQDYYGWQIGNGEGLEMDVCQKQGKICLTSIHKIETGGHGIE